jgi:DNA-directed RNA polymerase specialized sigma24 family protein
MAPVRDPVEAVARVADARRDRLLRFHRRRLRWEDLEDCYSQATLELVARARRDPFSSSEHIQNALEQKFSSRIDDRRRAIGGRSPIEMAIATALPVDMPEAGAGELEDPSAEVVRQVVARLEVRRLREVADELTEDQRLVLACQISLGMDCAEFCRRFGWSSEKFRKVAQRGRGRLRALVAEYEVGERCARLEPDLIAFAAQTATAEQGRRATAHLTNCTACSAHFRALERASREVAALLPAPVLVRAGLLGKLGGVAVALRRVLGVFGGGAETGAAGVAGGSAVGAGALKIGVVAACLAGAAGGYAICAGVPGTGRPSREAREVARVRPANHAVEPAERRVATLAAVSHRSAPAVTRVGLARGRLAAEVAEREFSGGEAHTAEFAGGSGSIVALRSSVSPSSGSALRSGSPPPQGPSAPGGAPVGGGTLVPTGSPVRPRPPGQRVAGEAQSEFGGFEH